MKVERQVQENTQEQNVKKRIKIRVRHMKIGQNLMECQNIKLQNHNINRINYNNKRNGNMIDEK